MTHNKFLVLDAHIGHEVLDLLPDVVPEAALHDDWSAKFTELAAEHHLSVGSVTAYIYALACAYRYPHRQTADYADWVEELIIELRIPEEQWQEFRYYLTAVLQDRFKRLLPDYASVEDATTAH